MRLVLQLLRWLDLVLQLFIPVKQQRLCYASRPDYADNSYHLFRHALQTRNNLEHVWLIGNKDAHAASIEADFSQVTQASGTTGNRLRIVKRRSLMGYWLYLSSRNVFHTHGLYIFPGYSIRRNIVSLWHGMVIKRVGKLNPIAPSFYPTYGTLHIATSHFFKYIVACAFNSRPEQVLVCPYPRIDPLVDPHARSMNGQAIRDTLELQQDNRLVLWLPTYRTEPSNTPTSQLDVRSFLDDIDDHLLHTLNHEAATRNTIILVKLHPYDRLNDLKTPFAHSNIRLIDAKAWESLAIPLYDLVAESDALLTDISSIMADYVITNRPIGLIGLDANTYARGTTFPLSYLFNSGCFQQLDTSDSIAPFMDMVTAGVTGKNARPAQADIFIEPFEKSGSEQILAHLGL